MLHVFYISYFYVHRLSSFLSASPHSWFVLLSPLAISCKAGDWCQGQKIKVKVISRSLHEDSKADGPESPNFTKILTRHISRDFCIVISAIQ